MNNCFFWALRKWRAEGGYIAFRRSRFGWWPHCFWSADMRRWYSYSPDDPRHKACPPPLFHGRVKEGDE